MEKETFNITSKQYISVNTLVNDKTASHKQINNPPTQSTSLHNLQDQVKKHRKP